MYCIKIGFGFVLKSLILHINTTVLVVKGMRYNYIFSALMQYTILFLYMCYNLIVVVFDTLTLQSIVRYIIEVYGHAGSRH